MPYRAPSIVCPFNRTTDLLPVATAKGAFAAHDRSFCSTPIVFAAISCPHAVTGTVAGGAAPAGACAPNLASTAHTMNPMRLMPAR
jgi:hypothetical protein